MSDFKIGDIIKRPNGKYLFEVINIRNLKRRFGDILIKNLETGKIYWDFSKGRGRSGRRQPFILAQTDIKPKVIKNLKFNFKKGI